MVGSGGRRRAALVSAVGDDVFGRFVTSVTRRAGVDVDSVVSLGSHRTAVCNIHLTHDGDLDSAVADMGVFDRVEFAQVRAALERHTSAKHCVIDANVSVACLHETASFCQAHNVSVWFEPTSIAKCIKVCLFFKIIIV